jgi:hypothetical protein
MPRAGVSACVFVMGEAGIGKSRLVAEAALAAHARDGPAGAESEQALPFDCGSTRCAA